MPVENRNELQAVTPDPIRNDVRSLGHDQLARPGEAARPAQLRVSFEQFDRVENAARYQSCVLLGVLFDLFSKAHQVANRPAGPHDLHRGALVSPGFPHDFSHFETFSWLTISPESRSAIPA